MCMTFQTKIDFTYINKFINKFKSGPEEHYTKSVLLLLYYYNIIICSKDEYKNRK